jgi:hypothetical protein
VLPCPSVRSSIIGIVQAGAIAGWLGEVVTVVGLSFLHGAIDTIRGSKS